jgi:SAM-dependent methyltransferase
MTAPSQTNASTLESYEHRLDAYIQGSPQSVNPELEAFIGRAFEGVAKDATVLELGAGFGRDALYLQSLGFAVIPTDAALSFVGELQQRGFPAYQLNVLTDEIPAADVIYANAVFLHLTRAELTETLSRCRAALNPQGRLIFTLKQGSGEEWSEEKLSAPRYFVYWEAPALTALLQGAGFSSVSIAGEWSGSSSWLMVTAS